MAWNPFASTQQQPAQQRQQQPAPQPQPQMTATQQSQQGPQNSQFPQGNPQGAPANGPLPADPFAPFQQMFNNPAQAQQQVSQQNQQQNPTAAPAAPAYDGYVAPWNADRVRQGLGAVDFTRSANPEVMQRITAGDMSALPELLNHVARESTYQALQASHQFVDRGVKTGLDRFGGSLDDRIRDYAVRTDNPEHEVLNNPSVAPMYSAIKQTIAQNNPSFSPAQVNKMAMDWFNTVSTQMTSKNQAQQTAQNPGPQEPNWAEAFGIAAPQQQQQNFNQGQ